MPPDSGPASNIRHGQIAVLAGALFFYAIGYCWNLAIMSQYLTDIVCLDGYNATFEECQNDTSSWEWKNVTVDANNLSVALMVPSAVTQAVMAPLLSTLADSFGRKPVLIFSMSCAAVSSICVALLPWTLFQDVGVYVMAVSGLGGGLFGYLAVTFACVIDLFKHQSDKERAIAIGRVEAFCWAGLCLGPFIGKWVSDWIAPHSDATGIQKTFFFAFGFQVLGISVLAVLLWEPWRCARPKLIDFIPYGPLWKIGSASVIWITIANAVVQFAASCGVELLPDFIFAYWKAPDELSTLSFVFTVYFGFCGVGELVLLPLLSRCLPRRMLLLVAIIATALSWAAFGLAGLSNYFGIVWIAAVACCFNSLVFPIVRTFITRALGPQHYGNGLGLLAFLEQLGAIFAPYFEKSMWKTEVSIQVPGVSFFVFGGVALLGVLFASLVKFSPLVSSSSSDTGASTDLFLENPASDCSYQQLDDHDEHSKHGTVWR